MNVKIFRLLLACLLLLFVSGFPNAARAGTEHQDEYEEDFDFSPGGQFNLTNISGTVRITGWDAERVELRAVKIVPRAVERSRALEMMDEVKIEVRKSEKKIEVTTKYPKGKKWFSFDMKDDNFLEDPNAGLLKSLVHKLNSFWDGLTASIDRAVKVTVDYEIKLPWDTGVKLNNVNGDVWIVEIEGGQEINIVNGDLRLVRSGGRVEANLVSGKLEIIDATGSVEVNNINGPIYAGLGGGADADFNTVNGDITISVPDSAALDFRLTTLSGSVEVGLPVELKRKSTGKKLAARLNGGGPLIDANAVNGDILVKKK